MDSTERSSDEPSTYGLKLRLNHEYPLQSKQVISPTVKQAIDLVPLTARYLKYYIGKKMQNKRPIMDYINLVSAQRMYGCPIGGIGGGTIGRGFKGEFCRFQLYPGIYEYVTNPECQFIVNIQDADNKTIFQSVLSTYEKPKKTLPTWEWNLDGADCEYTALYPRAWTTYDLSKYGIKLICRQISPVIPNNYKDTSMPCAVFVWTVKNVCNERRTVSISFTWAEILPNKKKPNSKLDIERYSEGDTCGVTLEQKIADIPCTFTIATTKQDHESIHEGYCMFNVAKGSSYVWECLKANGRLEPDTTHGAVPNKQSDAKSNTKKKTVTNKSHRCDAVGLSSVLTVEAGGSDVMEFCLSWDMPIIKYKKDGPAYKRFYTKYFGSDGIAGASIAAYALRNYKKWERQLAQWQDPILTNSNIPDWLKSALMNELYFIADGGTIWFDVTDEYPESDPRHHFGIFGYLEGHEYRMYNTYDVHFYASFALAQLWPNLQVVLQYMFRDTITQESHNIRKSLYDGKTVKHKIKHSIPHDLGDPYDAPFTHINAYNIHDVSEWRDLNTKFVLQVMRDYRLLLGHSAPFPADRYRSLEFIDAVRADGTPPPSPALRPAPAPAPAHVPAAVAPPPRNILEMLYRSVEPAAEEGEGEGQEEGEGAGQGVWPARQYLADMYDACAALVRRSRVWDHDDDGLVENSGSPDQTYDTWVMTGPSAYCGGLWVSALWAVRGLARLAEREGDAAEFAALLERARAAYERRLWAGRHYRFDTDPANGRVVMADQLAGHWFLRACGLSEEIFPDENVKKVLRTIYENNVLKFCDGKMGAVNGYVLGEKSETGHVDHSVLQSGEMWTGVTYGLAAVMIYEGMYEEAFKTAGGMYSTLTQMGLAFETPEAMYENGNHRSVAYMRPLSVWGMYHALVSRAPPSSAPTAPTAAAVNGGLSHTKL